jgi:hypothetical protein
VPVQSTCLRVFEALRESFVRSKAGNRTLISIYTDDAESSYAVSPLSSLKHELEASIKAFDLAHTKALKRLYRHYPTTGLEAEDGGDPSSFKPGLDMSRPNEQIFLLYFFLLSVQPFAPAFGNPLPACS